ncbi:MAG: Nif3-like dinuclear metal center hexameric protein [Cyclobacteriaceae bacterium]|nr:Nif3-like dinuclear metal center hexameric protein [Cyclobacteriaceae bacterium]
MQTPKIKDVAAFLESWAPRAYQESYDNVGLLVGNPEMEVKGILVSLDCTESVVEEAGRRGCNLVVSHHPVLFKGLKSLTGKTYVERTVLLAIQKGIALYAIHTNLDNVRLGVNARIAQRIGLTQTRILVPRKGTLSKLVTFVPPDNLEAVLGALHGAGAGQIGNYQNCSFEIRGTGRFQPGESAQPHIGTPGSPEKVEEVRVEVLLPEARQQAILAALRQAHPYEEVAYYLTPLSNENQEVGSGLIGTLPQAMDAGDFLRHVKETMQASVVRYTSKPTGPIRRVAVCGGAGSFLLGDAIRQQADAFLSADFKYHEFFDAEGKIMVCDIGHYESEQFTKALLQEVLSEKFTTFASHFSETVTNPISYF